MEMHLRFADCSEVR